MLFIVFLITLMLIQKNNANIDAAYEDTNKFGFSMYNDDLSYEKGFDPNSSEKSHKRLKNTDGMKNYIPNEIDGLKDSFIKQNLKIAEALKHIYLDNYNASNVIPLTNKCNCGSGHKTKTSYRKRLDRCGCGHGKQLEDAIRTRYQKFGDQKLRDSDLLSQQSVQYFEDVTDNYNNNRQRKSYGKKYKVNENLDITVIDVTDINKLLDAVEDFDDTPEENLSATSRNSETVLKLNSKENEQMRVAKKRLTTKDTIIVPEDFLKLYRKLKNEMIDTLTDPVKDIKKGKEDASFLDDLRNEIRSKSRTYSDREINKNVAKTILGSRNPTRGLRQTQKKNDTYIPRWFYNIMLRHKNDQELRSNKSLLPSGAKQRQQFFATKSNKKNSGTKNFWRQGMESRFREYGVPFEIDVTGLGQINKI